MHFNFTDEQKPETPEAMTNNLFTFEPESNVATDPVILEIDAAPISPVATNIPNDTSNSNIVKYNKIEQDVRERIISLYSQNVSIGSISEAVCVKRSTIYSIIKNFEKDGKISKSSKGGDKSSILSTDEKTIIISWVDEEPTMTLKNLVDKTWRVISNRVSISTIDRCLRNFHYSIKNVVLSPIRRNDQSTLIIRQNYAHIFISQLLNQNENRFVFCDEVGFQVSTRVKKGRSRVGTSVIVDVPSIRTRNISVIAAVTKSRTINFNIHNGPVNGDRFTAYMVDLKLKCQSMGILNPIFILDNGRIHHYSGFIQACNTQNLEVMYLPPYSPFLNIIENCFSKWKNHVLRGSANNNEVELNGLIHSGFDIITEEDCEGYFRNMLRYVEKSRNMEVIE